MDVTTEKITPAKALAWLNKNKTNRTLREGVAEKYAADMVSGRWTRCTDPIAFYDDEDVANGQHRLFAICESGTTQTFIVVRGLSRADGLNIDTGLGRSLIDNARISGKDEGLSVQLLAYCRAIEDGNYGAANSARGKSTVRARTNAERLELATLHREAAEWTMKFGPSGKLLRNSAVMGAIGRAWYVESDKERLAAFGEVLKTGLYEGEGDTAAIALRNYIFSKAGLAASPTLWRDTFLKTQNAIVYFMRGKKLTAIKAISEEQYPLKKSRGRK